MVLFSPITWRHFLTADSGLLIQFSLVPHWIKDIFGRNGSNQSSLFHQFNMFVILFFYNKVYVCKLSHYIYQRAQFYERPIHCQTTQDDRKNGLKTHKNKNYSLIYEAKIAIYYIIN